MIFLINIIPFLIAGFGMTAFYFVKGWNRKVSTVLFAIGVSLLYTQVQPNYMPKGTVRSTPLVEFKPSDVQIIDRGLKPKSSEQYDLERNAALKQIDDSIREQIKSKE